MRRSVLSFLCLASVATNADAFVSAVTSSAIFLDLKTSLLVRLMVLVFWCLISCPQWLQVNVLPLRMQRNIWMIISKIDLKTNLTSHMVVPTINKASIDAVVHNWSTHDLKSRAWKRTNNIWYILWCVTALFNQYVFLYYSRNTLYDQIIIIFY